MVDKKRTEFQDEQIYRDIVAAISSLKLHPGTQLKETELKQIYNVTRARIREVLLRLEHDQIVVRISNRGAFVAKPGIDEAREVFSARCLIEGRMVAQLAEREDKSFVPLLERQIEHEQLVREGGDFSKILHEGEEFHSLLAEIANNSIISAYVQELMTRSSLICVLYQRGETADCELDEHRQLVACITDGHADDAEKLMVAHLGGILSRLDLSVPRETQINIRKILGALEI